MRRTRHTIAAILVLAGMAVPAAALEAYERQALLAEANEHFREANALAGSDPEAAQALYEKAILRFERLAGEGGVQNGKLYYNLGNAYFLSGGMGRAILNYRRAALFRPKDTNVQQNLRYARAQRRDRIEEASQARVLKTLFFWHYDIAAPVRAAVFAVFFILLWGLAAMRVFLRRKGLVWAALGCAAVSLCLFASLTVDAASHARDRSGVILTEEVTARKGNGETYQPSFKEPLHAGTEFQLEEARGDWCYVTLHDGRRCWVPRPDTALVWEP